MATEPKLKVNIGADTSQFDKGIRQVKGDLKSFGQVSDDVLGKLGQALGVDTGQIEKMSSAIRGMGQQLQKSGEEGTAAFGKMLSGVSSLSAGLAALGIAGIVAGFKALNAEAENFKATIAGANIELQTNAYITTYKQALHDVNAEVGKGVAESQSKWQKFWATLPQRLASTTATMAGGTATGMATLGGPTPQQLQLQQQIDAAQQSAVSKAERAEQITGRIFEIDRQRSDNLRTIADLEKSIAEYKRIMRSETSTLAEKQNAYDKAVELTNQKFALQVPLMKERSQLVDEMNSLTATTVDQADQANQLYAQAVHLEEQQEDELRSLERLSKGITTATRQTNAELEKHLALMKQIEEIRGLNLGVSGVPTAGATTQQGSGLVPQVINTTAFEQQLNATLGNNMVVEIGVQIEKGSLMDLSRQVESVMAGLAESMSSAIGGLIGDLVTGGDAWGNFANAAMSAFGDMATSVGKIAIECGIAALGIKAALETLGPAGALAAIAAGTALVALGAAVKAGMSNIANGNYSASTSVASSSYSSGGDYETRDLNIHVTGQLQADGDSLVAVLNNTNNRNGYTT